MNPLLEYKPFRYGILSVLVLLSLFLLVSTWNGAFARGQFEPVNVITVEGTGEVNTVPDIARITFTVSETGASVKAAQDLATKKSDAALAAIKKLGVADKDVKTLGYNVSPKYDYNQPCPPGAMCPMMVSGTPKIVGYDVSQTVEVKVRDTAKAGEVLAALGTEGVQNISGPEFMVDDEDEVKAEAREKAIAEARTKAKKLASELGVRLGHVVSYSEGGNYPQPMYAMGGKALSMDARVESVPTLPTGENKTSVTVMVTYEIR